MRRNVGLLSTIIDQKFAVLLLLGRNDRLGNDGSLTVTTAVAAKTIPAVYTASCGRLAVRGATLVLASS